MPSILAHRCLPLELGYSCPPSPKTRHATCGSRGACDYRIGLGPGVAYGAPVKASLVTRLQPSHRTNIDGYGLCAVVL